jgi:hypothetical protein
MPPGDCPAGIVVTTRLVTVSTTEMVLSVVLAA